MISTSDIDESSIRNIHLIEIQSQLPTKNSKQPLSKNIKCQCKNKILQKEISTNVNLYLQLLKLLFFMSKCTTYALKANRVINPKVKNHATIRQV